MIEPKISQAAKRKQRDGAALSPKLHEDGLPIGKSGEAVARRYKHAAGKSSTYSPEVVDMIYHMAREGPMSDEQISQFVAAKLQAEREPPRPGLAATWDQLVFLSANLTRLVIDPYREKCNSQVQIGSNRPRPLCLDWPVIFGGVDFGRLPESLLGYAAAAAQSAKLAVGVEPGWPVADAAGVQRIVAVDVTRPAADLNDAAAVEIYAPDAATLNRLTLAPALDAIRRQTGGQIPVGVVAPAFNAPAVVDETIALDLDFYVTDAHWTTRRRPDAVFPELAGGPAIHVLTDTVERLRHHSKEETVAVIYRGGIRNGADAGKALCLGAKAATLGLAVVVGMGFKLIGISDETSLLAKLAQPLEPSDAVRRVVNVAKSVIMEVTMLARACGKSSVSNMEPEDLRSLSISVSQATGVPVAGKDFDFRSGPPNEQRPAD